MPGFNMLVKDERRIASGTYEMANSGKLLDIGIENGQQLDNAKAIQKETGKKQVGMDGNIYPLKDTMPAQGGSTDVGDVSQLVPVVRLSTPAAPKDAPWHSWAVVACTGMSIGHKGMLQASKALGMTMVDLFENPKLIKEVKAEFNERKGKSKYKAMIPAGPPPVPAK